MKFEMNRLTQCTRIFPPEPKAEPKAGEDDVDVKEEEENEEENDGQQEQKVKKDGTSSKTKTVATYEDIIYKVDLSPSLPDDLISFILRSYFWKTSEQLIEERDLFPIAPKRTKGISCRR